jgi:hypothetical protein
MFPILSQLFNKQGDCSVTDVRKLSVYDGLRGPTQRLDTLILRSGELFYSSTGDIYDMIARVKCSRQVIQIYTCADIFTRRLLQNCEV